MALTWCPYDEDINDFSEGPSLCFLMTAFSLPVDLVFLGLFIWKLQAVAEAMEFDFIDQMIKIQASFISGACICMCVFSLVFGLVLSAAACGYLFIAAEVAVWLVAGVLVKLEAYRAVRWPNALLLVFFSLSAVINLLIAANAVQADRPVGVIIDAVCMVAGSLCAALLGLLRGCGEGEGEGVYQHSLDFSRANPVTRSHSNSSTGDIFLRTLKLDKLFSATSSSTSEGVRSMKSFEQPVSP